MVEQGSFSPEEEEVLRNLVDNARGFKTDQKPNFLAISQAFLVVVRKKLLRGSPHQQFFDGLGFILIGSLAMGIAAAKKNGFWQDDIYMTSFNECIKNTSVTPISTDIKKQSGYTDDTIAEDTIRVNALSTKSDEEKIIILSQNPKRLPVIVRFHLSGYKHEISTIAFRMAASYFVEVSTRFTAEPPSQTSQQSSSITSNIDPTNLAENQLRAGETPAILYPGVEQFLEKVSRELEP